MAKASTDCTIYGPRQKAPEGATRINVTSKAAEGAEFKDAYSLRALSPFNAGPVTVYFGTKRMDAKRMENGYQYLKAYRGSSGLNGSSPHLDAGDHPTKEFLLWALEGIGASDPRRFPMGRGARPAFAVWRNGTFGYVASRLLIYIPMYVEAIIRSSDARAAYLSLKKAWEAANKSGKRIALFDYDGYDYAARGMTLTQVVCNQDEIMGHAFVLAMLLQDQLMAVVRESCQTVLKKIPHPIDLPPDFSPLRPGERLHAVSTGGAIVYLRPACLNRIAAWVMECLRPGGTGQIEWERRAIMMYGKEAKENKASAFFGDPGTNYRYAGKNHEPSDWSEDKSGALLACLFIARLITGEEYNFCLANWYETCFNSLGNHSDDEKDLYPGSSIGSMSLGAERPFVFEPKGGVAGTGAKTVSIVLPSGSFLQMAGLTQKSYKHGVPVAKTVVGSRLNLTFRRVIPGRHLQHE